MFGGAPAHVAVWVSRLPVPPFFGSRSEPARQVPLDAFGVPRRRLFQRAHLEQEFGVQLFARTKT